VIDSLDSNNLRFERMIVLVHVLQKLKLRRRGPNDENLFGVSESASDISEETVCIVWVVVLGRRAPRVTLEAPFGRVNRQLVRFPDFHAEDARLMVVHPDNCLTQVHLSVLFCCAA
jgi:hypothetical protein